jgi:hypothetical protein
VGDEAQKMYSVAAANERNVENACLYKRLLLFRARDDSNDVAHDVTRHWLGDLGIPVGLVHVHGSNLKLHTRP